jgi:hypothetical protein
MRWLFVSGFFVVPVLGAAQPGRVQEVPAVVSRFSDALRSGAPLADLSALRFPLTVLETAYEVGDGWCQPRYRKTLLHNSKNLEMFLEGLRGAWKDSRVIAANRQNYYGTAGHGDCEHFWGVKLDSRGLKILQLVVDAPKERGGNQWTPARKDFDIMDLP